jgi:hypothetical protein
MFPYLLSAELVDQIRRWPELKRWERREIGQTLRRLGLSYTEIAAVIPVSKGTLSGWCRDVELRADHVARLASMRPQTTVGPVLRARNAARVETIREAARTEALGLAADPFWVAGVSLYWAEGAKRHNDVAFANSDPEMVRIFIQWARLYLDLAQDRFTAKLHLHDGQSEKERKAFWSDVTGIPESDFRKTFIKPEGSGHRKNVLYNGTIQVRITRSTDLLHRLLGWIDAVAYGELLAVESRAWGASSTG